MDRQSFPPPTQLIPRTHNRLNHPLHTLRPLHPPILMTRRSTPPSLLPITRPLILTGAVLTPLLTIPIVLPMTLAPLAPPCDVLVHIRYVQRSSPDSCTWMSRNSKTKSNYTVPTKIPSARNCATKASHDERTRRCRLRKPPPSTTDSLA